MLRKTGIFVLAIATIMVGLVVGTLNADPVTLDLLWTKVELPLGLAILAGFSLGMLAGLTLLYFTRVLPLRLKLRKARLVSARLDAGETSTPDD